MYLVKIEGREMNSDEYIVFLKSLLVKIENALNLIEQPVPKHIPSYRKILGVQQKIVELPIEYKNKMFSQLIGVRGILNYFLNGRYKEAHSHIIKLKTDLVKICFNIIEKENERDSDKKL